MIAIRRITLHRNGVVFARPRKSTISVQANLLGRLCRN
jgi:hypothetical protein